MMQLYSVLVLVCGHVAYTVINCAIMVGVVIDRAIDRLIDNLDEED